MVTAAVTMDSRDRHTRLGRTLEYATPGLYSTFYLENVVTATAVLKIGAGVTGQNIPPTGVYPGILWPRPIYTGGILWPMPIYNGGILWPRPINTPTGHKVSRAINWPRP